ncbi:MAG: hypothetical protein H0X33_10790 [Taibaiella sp.]|nr:hypothetical protein [Taibaiella sp.]
MANILPDGVKSSVTHKQSPELNSITADVERILQFGTFEYNAHNKKAIYSNGIYHMFGYNDNKPSIIHDIFLSNHLSHARNMHADIAIEEYIEEHDIITADNFKKRIQITGKRYFKNNMLSKNVGIIRDITREREQQEAMGNAISELQRSNKELENFAYVASHDLLEPVRKISTFSTRLSEKLSGVISDADMMFLERISSSADNMRMLVDNLLEYSRLATEKHIHADTNLNFIFRQVIQDLELTIAETGAHIVGDKLPLIQSSSTQMRQLFTNIISNAIKFRKPDAVAQIYITTSAITPEDIDRYNLTMHVPYHKIEIMDNGIGFDDEYAERIFQIFQRLHGKSDYPGSGIGLAICRKIVEQHKGAIYARNVPDQGAIFTIILPEKQLV